MLSQVMYIGQNDEITGEKTLCDICKEQAEWFIWWKDLAENTHLNVCDKHKRNFENATLEQAEKKFWKLYFKPEVWLGKGGDR